MHLKILSDIVAIFKNAFCPFSVEPIQSAASVVNGYFLDREKKAKNVAMETRNVYIRNNNVASSPKPIPFWSGNYGLRKLIR